jgi:hypothetical protein
VDLQEHSELFHQESRHDSQKVILLHSFLAQLSGFQIFDFRPKLKVSTNLNLGHSSKPAGHNLFRVLGLSRDPNGNAEEGDRGRN